VLTRTDTTGSYFIAPVTPLRMIAFAAIVGALVAVVVAMRRRRPALARLGVMALVVLAAGMYTGSNVPLGIEVNRPNLYRWTWTAAFLTWVTLGWALGVVVRERVHPNVDAVRYALAGAAVFIAGTTVVVSGADDHNRESPAFDVERTIGRAVVERLDHDEPVLVMPSGGRSSINVAAYVTYRLVEADVPIRLPAADARFLGRHRRVQPDDDVPVLVIRSAVEPFEPVDGEVVAEAAFDPELTRLADELAAAVEGRDVDLAPDAQEIIAARHPDAPAQRLVRAGLAELRTDPARALRKRVVLELVLDGVLRSPDLDRATVARLLDRLGDPATFLRDERVQAVLVPADRAASLRR
jgi:hypothetical protein